MSSSTKYPWKRYWVEKGENPVMESGLFVQPKEGGRWYGPKSNGVSLSELNKVPCLILLGDVGMGKTTTIELAAEELKQKLSGSSHAVVYHDLKRMSEMQIERIIFDNPQFESWLKGEHALTIFLDSVDECWRRIDSLEIQIAEGLDRRIKPETPSLFLRLACRSAEWRGEAGDTLRRYFDKWTGRQNQIKTYILAPLSADNVRDAANSKSLNGKRLLERIAAKGAEALASHPITLEMLLQMYHEEGDFPTSRAQLYLDGCRRLCADRHVITGKTQQRQTTPDERLAVVSRLAALCILSNRLLINCDFENLISRSDVLEPADALGHLNEKINGTSIVVSNDKITEALQTGLFAERIEGCQTWRHQSYAEFLAAHYLVQRRLQPAQVAGLLTDTSDNVQRIIPQLEETACWAAEMYPELFSLLAKKNADVLLRCDTTYWNDANRSVLVESYLDLVRRHEAAELDWQLKSRLARLAHPTIADQLRLVITNSAENPLVRETAIDIAGSCACKTLEEQLIEVFLNTNDIFRIRQRAGFFLEQSAGDDVRSSLRIKTVSDWTGDENDDLKGYYFHIMWPSHLLIHEVLPLKPPKKTNYSGSYKMFVEYKLPETIQNHDLPFALDWLREHKISFDILGPFGYLPSKILWKSLHRMDNSAIRDAVLKLIGYDKYQLHYMFQNRSESEQLSGEERKAFWRAVVSSELDIKDLISYGDLRQAQILLPEDLIEFAREFHKSSEARIRDSYRTLIFHSFSIENSKSVEILSDLARSDDTIRQNLADWTTCRIVPDDVNWAKQHFQREQRRIKREPVSKVSLVDSICAAIADFETGKFQAYWFVLELLECDPANMQRVMLNIQLSEGKAWKLLPCEIQSRILAGAVPYLSAQPVEEFHVWDTATRYRPYDVVNPLLVLLYDTDKSAIGKIPDEMWSKWMGVIFTYCYRRNGNHDEARTMILTTAYLKAKSAFLSALKRQLHAQINEDSERRVIWHLAAVWQPEIETLVISLLKEMALKPFAARDIFQLLIFQNINNQHILESFTGHPATSTACSLYLPASVAVLTTNFPEVWGKRFLKMINNNPALGKAIIPLLLYGQRHPANWLSRLLPENIAEFWEWLGDHYPGNPYDTQQKGGSVTVQHEVYQFRGHVFETLRQAGTSEACEAMRNLMERRPIDFWLGDVLADMRKALHRKDWVRPSPPTLMQLFAATEKRIVRTAGELQSLVIDSLRRFESSLKGVPPSLELWNEIVEKRKRICQPKDEMNLSNCLKRFLDNDLVERGIISNREVQIRRRFGDEPAQVVDIVVNAVPIGEDGHPNSPVSVVVEVKCAWNDGVLLDMDCQLYHRYLKNSEFHFGIYAVAYFSCAAWNAATDERRSSGESQTSLTDLEKKLSAQAASLTTREKLVESIVIDARLGAN